MPADTMTPAERILRAHIADGRFQIALDAGHWKVEYFDFPVLDVCVYAPSGDVGLRFDMTEYPGRAPAGRPWDLERSLPLEPCYWPTGTIADKVFRRDWSPQHGDALYLDLDRIALESHNDWPSKYSGRAWDNTKTISDYLQRVHAALRGSTIPPRPAPT